MSRALTVIVMFFVVYFALTYMHDGMDLSRRGRPPCNQSAVETLFLSCEPIKPKGIAIVPNAEKSGGMFTGLQYGEGACRLIAHMAPFPHLSWNQARTMFP